MNVTIPRRTFLVAVASVALALCWTARAAAGGGPENTLLIVNARGEKSKEVANHYIALRHIPATNVFYVPAPPNATQMTGRDFREQILRPALAEMDRRGIRDHIDQLVYSCDFPFQINCSELLGLPDVQSTARPIASLTGATYLYQLIEGANKELTQLNTNFYFAPTVDGSTETRVFRARDRWLPGGVRGTAEGMQYLLSTQLGSTAPDGNSVAEIVASLKRAAAADGARPPGIFFYMKNDNIRSSARDGGFAAAVAELRALGLKAEVGNGVVPSGQHSILGLTTGSAQVRLLGSGSELAPGALVDNLTSAGGIMLRTTNPNPQTRVSEFLRRGAAGASGTVVEPFAIAEKFPSPALHVHYARGASMAEAFYASVRGPFQLLVVGDPLCQPWAFLPEVTVSGVTDGAIVSGTVEITPAAKLFGKRTVQRFELFVDGRPHGERTPGQKFALDTSRLGDGYHELRVIAVDNTPVETQGSWIGGVIVKNGRDAVSVTAAGGPRITGPMLALTVTSTVEGESIVLHNGRELGRVTGRRGTLQVPTEKLGKGPVVIVARTVGEQSLRSRPLPLEIL